MLLTVIVFLQKFIIYRHLITDALHLFCGVAHTLTISIILCLIVIRRNRKKCVIYQITFFFFLCKLKESKKEINLMYYASNCFILHFYGIILKLLLIKEAGTSPSKVWFPASIYPWINPCLSTRL